MTAAQLGQAFRAAEPSHGDLSSTKRSATLWLLVPEVKHRNGNRGVVGDGRNAMATLMRATRRRYGRQPAD